MGAKRGFTRRTFWGGALLLTWAVLISGVLGNGGLIQAYRLDEVRRDLAIRIRALECERSRLQDRLEGLKHDAFSQEQAIRDTLGFVREDEIVFEFR